MHIAYIYTWQPQHSMQVRPFCVGNSRCVLLPCRRGVCADCAQTGTMAAAAQSVVQQWNDVVHALNKVAASTSPTEDILRLHLVLTRICKQTHHPNPTAWKKLLKTQVCCAVATQDAHQQAGHSGDRVLPRSHMLPWSSTSLICAACLPVCVSGCL